MVRDELRDLIIETRGLVKKLTKIWENFEDPELIEPNLEPLICDSCEEKEE